MPNREERERRRNETNNQPMNIMNQIPKVTVMSIEALCRRFEGARVADGAHHGPGLLTGVIKLPLHEDELGGADAAEVGPMDDKCVGGLIHRVGVDPTGSAEGSESVCDLGRIVRAIHMMRMHQSAFSVQD